jgi:integration host factor subunit beta
MNKKELIKVIHADVLKKRNKDNGISQKFVSDVMDSFIDVILDSVKQGKIIKIVGLFVISVIEKGPRVIRNPRTGEKTNVGKSHSVKIKVGTELKEAAAASMPVKKVKK